MGMFNYVNYKCPCPNCGTEVSDWQTKDGADLYMTHVNPSAVDYFYTSCPKCGCWLDATVQKIVTVTGVHVSAVPMAEKFKPRKEVKLDGE